MNDDELKRLINLVNLCNSLPRNCDIGRTLDNDILNLGMRYHLHDKLVWNVSAEIWILIGYTDA